jgi:hypothetical protein
MFDDLFVQAEDLTNPDSGHLLNRYTGYHHNCADELELPQQNR